MIIDDFHFQDVGTLPAEADTVLVVDADAVLADPVEFQGFEVVAADGGEVMKARGGIEDVEAAFGLAFDGSKLPASESEEDGSGVGTLFIATAGRIQSRKVVRADAAISLV